jgi:RNA polymerase sigma-70 factor, ECF subfamily
MAELAQIIPSGSAGNKSPSVGDDTGDDDADRSHRSPSHGRRPSITLKRNGLRSMLRHVTPAGGSNACSAFEAEVLPHVDRLYRLAMWLERNRADAEDVVQDTMMQALRSFHRFRPGTNCRAWLVTILQRVVSNRRRTKGRAIVGSDPDDRLARTLPFVPPVPEQLTDETLLATLRRLPLAFQEVIVLCDVEELSYKEAAEALAIPVGTVMSRLHRGRAQLRTELAATDTVVAARRVER